MTKLSSWGRGSVAEDDLPIIKLNRTDACDENFVSLLSPTDIATPLPRMSAGLYMLRGVPLTKLSSWGGGSVAEDDLPIIKLNRTDVCDEKFVSLLSPTDIATELPRMSAGLYMLRGVPLMKLSSWGGGSVAEDDLPIIKLNRTDVCDETLSVFFPRLISRQSCHACLPAFTCCVVFELDEVEQLGWGECRRG